MKRKSLLLLIPLAIVGLAGCENANPGPNPKPDPNPCDQCETHITERSVEVEEGKTVQLHATTSVSGCPVAWASDHADVASVDGNGVVTGVSSSVNGGIAHISANGVQECTVTVKPSGQPVHEHSFSTEWSKDENGHWHECSCGAKADEADHLFGDDNICDVCGYDKGEPVPHVHTFSPEWSSNDNEHWHAATCGHDVKDGLAVHVDTDGDSKCDVCNHAMPTDPVYGTEDNPISVSQALVTMGIDCPNDKDLTKQAMYCTGTIKEIKNVYHYEDDIGSDCFELVLTDGTNDVIVYRLHSTDDLKDQVAEGNEIKICGYGKNFKGTLEFVDNGATKCILLDNGTPTPEKEVTGITAVSYTKTLYVGGTINPADVTLTVSYSDGTSGSVKAQSVDGYSSAAVGKTTATAHYGTFTKTFEVDVSEAPSDPVVGQTFTKVNTQSDLSEGIYILGSGNYFFHGADEADKSIVVSDPGDSIVGLEGMAGLQIEEVSGGYSIKVLNGVNEGKYIGPKSGADKNIVFGSDPVAHTISVAEGVSTLTSGEKLLKFNDQTGQNRFRYYTSGQKDVVLYKQGTPAPQKTITGVELQGTLTKSSYVAGQTFDPSGLSLKVTYDDQSEETVTSGFTFNVTNPLTVGEYDLKATYQGHTTEGSVHISVVTLAITALEIKSGMTKTAYILEETWAPAGIVVEATYNDGSKANLQSGDYTLEFDPIEPALDTEEVSIVAKVANGITSAAYTQKVSVTEEKVEATLTGIVASGYTNTATVGQTYTFDGTVTASYSDGSSHAVTGYTWTTPINTETGGEKTGVISYTEGDVTKTCNVVVTVAAHENTVKTAYEAAIPMTGSDDAHKETGEMTFEGVVSAIQGNSFVVADGDYGILVYNYAVSGIDVGKTITVKATLKNYKGLIETSSTKSATLGAAGTIPTPVNVTSVTQLNGLKTNVLVNCAQLEVVSKETAWASNKTSNWVVKLNSSNVTLSLNQYAFESAKSSFIKGLNVGDVFSASNLTVGCYNNVNQLSVMRDTTFQAAPAKEITSLGDVTAPESIAKGGTLSVSDVSVAVTYDDTTTGSVHPDRIELDTSAVADSVTGTVYVGDLSATFTIKVEEAAQTKDYEFAYESKTNPTGLTSSVAAGGFETGGRLAQWSSCGGFTISTSNSYSNVTKVIVNTSTNGADNVYKISCTVGGNEFGSTVSMLKKSANEDIVFEDDAADGVVVITYTFTSGTKKSIYVGKVTITAK